MLRIEGAYLLSSTYGDNNEPKYNFDADILLTTMPMAELNLVINLFGFLQYLPPFPLSINEKNNFLGISQLITEHDLLLSSLPRHVRYILSAGHSFTLPLMHS